MSDSAAAAASVASARPVKRAPQRKAARAGINLQVTRVGAILRAECAPTRCTSTAAISAAAAVQSALEVLITEAGALAESEGRKSIDPRNVARSIGANPGLCAIWGDLVIFGAGPEEIDMHAKAAELQDLNARKTKGKGGASRKRKAASGADAGAAGEDDADAPAAEAEAAADADPAPPAKERKVKPKLERKPDAAAKAKTDKAPSKAKAPAKAPAKTPAKTPSKAAAKPATA
jgi:histone H3/H4